MQTTKFDFSIAILEKMRYNNYAGQEKPEKIKEKRKKTMYFATTEIYGNVWGARNREGRLVYTSKSITAVQEYCDSHKGCYMVAVPQYR